LHFFIKFLHSFKINWVFLFVFQKSFFLIFPFNLHLNQPKLLLLFFLFFIILIHHLNLELPPNGD
jgi:hypothetical protein